MNIDHLIDPFKAFYIKYNAPVIKYEAFSIASGVLHYLVFVGYFQHMDDKFP